MSNTIDSTQFKFAVNHEWTGIFPSINLEYQWAEYIIRAGISKPGGYDEIITPVAIYKIKAIGRKKREVGLALILMNEENFGVTYVKTWKIELKNGRMF